jgi:hypothetical protein
MVWAYTAPSKKECNALFKDVVSKSCLLLIDLETTAYFKTGYRVMILQ